ncbi:MAG: 30S ribosomal protein S16 [candidate division KSB1 bacterium]|nr:30S ribosomal protein S16 [candidate division KSB1 bacterium]
MTTSPYGSKKVPFFRIVAVDSRTRRDGKFIEKLGTYNPRTEPAQIELDKDAAMKWLMQGAEPSDTVRSILSRHGVMLEFDLRKRGLSDEDIAKELESYQSRLQQENKKREAELAQKQREEEKRKRDQETKAKKEQEKAEAEAGRSAKTG